MFEILKSNTALWGAVYFINYIITLIYLVADR